MREKLLAYLLNELDATDRHLVEEAIESDPKVREEFECLRQCIEGEGADFASEECSDEQEENEATPNLASRTRKHVAVTTWSAGSMADPPNASTCRWRMADIVVAIGIVFAMGSFMLPAMLQSRNNARRLECENNLAQIYHGITEYASIHDGLIPQVPAEGKDAIGGIYSVALIDSLIIDRRDMARWQVCPSSKLASKCRGQRFTIRIPTRTELLSADGSALQLLQSNIGGSYAYRVGYIQDNKYHFIRFDPSRTQPLMSDAPSLTLAGFQSENHGNTGQNVLFADGHVSYLTTSLAPDGKDELFKNRRGYRAAGIGANDAVLLSSNVGPSIHVIIIRKQQ